MTWKILWNKPYQIPEPGLDLPLLGDVLTL